MLRQKRASLFLLGGFNLLLSALVAACGANGTGNDGGNAGDPAAGQGGSGAAGDPDDFLGDGDDFGAGEGACEGLECQQVACGGGGTTTVTGVVYEPAGKTPLYNVAVYVPNAPLEPLPEGASCDKCGSTLSGKPIVTAITDTSGQFVLENVPVGKDIPLVIQVGKWRRQITVPTVAACQDNPLSDPELTRLPKNQAEGDLPKIALTTGGADPLECLLRKIGLDDQEFSTAGGTGRVHLYRGDGGSEKYAPGMSDGATFAKTTQLWGQKETLMAYDIVLLACEGHQNPWDKPEKALQAMFDYAASGGRIFASHWHNDFLENGPDPFPQTATFNHQDDLPDPITAFVDTTFPKGQALADWLVHVGASQVHGEIEIKEAQHTVDAANPAMSQQWIYQPDFNSVQYFTFNTPIGVPAEEQCGRVVYTDIHVSSGDQIGKDFPDGCQTTDLSPQEKALLFTLFDLSACIQPDEDPVIDPPT